MNEHIFIIRMWAERRDIEGAPPEYRGVIQHAPSGEKQYLESTDAVRAFIAGYLEEMGVEVNQLDQLNNWLRSQKKS